MCAAGRGVVAFSPTAAVPRATAVATAGGGIGAAIAMPGAYTAGECHRWLEGKGQRQRCRAGAPPARRRPAPAPVGSEPIS